MQKATIRVFKLVIWGLAAFTASLVCACDAAKDRLQTPVQAGDGWETASLKSVGMEEAPFLDLLDLIEDTENHMIHSILVVKDNKLVFERYWPGTDLIPTSLERIERDFDRETLHYVASVSKSITSALVGIALKQGLIESVGTPIFDYFPEYADLVSDYNAQITVEHLLSFCSGYDWNEMEYGFDDPRDSHNQMFNAADPLEYLLGREMVSEPGAEFLYNSGDTNLVGEIVRRSADADTLVAFADQNLFGPLGINDYDWVRFASAPEVAFASGGVSLRPRDMAKLGALYLNGGAWNGVEIVSSSWVQASIEMSIPLTEGWISALYGYGYNWFLGNAAFHGGEIGYFRAAGWGGQNVFVFPAIDLIVVMTQGEFYEVDPIDGNALVEDYVLEAVVQ